MSDRPKPKVSVVIVTYNSSAVIDECLASLDLPNNKTIEVVVVDNASTDQTADLIRQRHPTVRTILSDQNDGFAVAVNRGATYATGDFIALVNPDAVLTAPALHALVDQHRKHSRPCITAPLIVDPNQRLRIVSAGRFPTTWRMFCHYFGLSRLRSIKLFQGHYLIPGSLRAVEPVDWATGAVLVVSMASWRHLEGLSQRWFMYAEDIEFCWRADASDIDVLLMTEVTATHLVGESTGEPKSMKADWVVNLYDFYKTSISTGPFTAAAWKAVVAAGLLSRSMVYRLQAFRGRTDLSAAVWRYESQRFLFFAKELVRS